jgi:hypothetical protein
MKREIRLLIILLIGLLVVLILAPEIKDRYVDPAIERASDPGVQLIPPTDPDYWKIRNGTYR